MSPTSRLEPTIGASSPCVAANAGMQAACTWPRAQVLPGSLGSVTRARHVASSIRRWHFLHLDRLDFALSSRYSSLPPSVLLPWARARARRVTRACLSMLCLRHMQCVANLATKRSAARSPLCGAVCQSQYFRTSALPASRRITGISATSTRAHRQSPASTWLCALPSATHSAMLPPCSSTSFGTVAAVALATGPVASPLHNPSTTYISSSSCAAFHISPRVPAFFFISSSVRRVPLPAALSFSISVSLLSVLRVSSSPPRSLPSSAPVSSSSSPVPSSSPSLASHHSDSHVFLARPCQKRSSTSTCSRNGGMRPCSAACVAIRATPVGVVLTTLTTFCGARAMKTRWRRCSWHTRGCQLQCPSSAQLLCPSSLARRHSSRCICAQTGSAVASAPLGGLWIVTAHRFSRACSWRCTRALSRYGRHMMPPTPSTSMHVATVAWSPQHSSAARIRDVRTPSYTALTAPPPGT